jgi:hypothetical protein
MKPTTIAACRGIIGSLRPGALTGRFRDPSASTRRRSQCRASSSALFGWIPRSLPSPARISDATINGGAPLIGANRALVFPPAPTNAMVAGTRIDPGAMPRAPARLAALMIAA